MDCRYLFLVGILSLSFSCKSTKDQKGDTVLESQATVYINEGLTEEDCHYPRKTIRSIEDELATIGYFAEEWLLSVGPSDKKYIPCDIPTPFHKEGLVVVFSGDKLEVMPHERRFAVPLRLKTLRIKD